ncbi:MAG TPA: 2-dehydropantoate 2-reductase [Candidatus Eisenbacteria bacterium]|nr:2-dehydropantoate 2-reductase [Candidatus Eisenbacteria bacterium]
MRIAVLGTGGVGGYFGAKLAAAGHRVVFIARGKHLEAMRQQGLTVKSQQGDLHVRDASFISDPAAAGAVDCVLVCVKSYDTEACARILGPLIAEETAILSLQNGIDNPDKLAAVWGKERVFAGVVYVASQLCAPGLIQHSAAGRIIFGPLERHRTAAAERLGQVLAAAFPCDVDPEIRRAQWLKLLWNAPFCALACLARANTREILESPSLSLLATDCMQEVRAAAQAHGIDLETETIDRTLAFSRTLGDFKPSMLQDLEAGKPLEHDAFNGIVVRSLERVGKRAPLNRVFYLTLSYLDGKIRGHWKGGR